MQPLLLWKSNKYYIFWVFVCSPGYAACNAHAPYCHMWPVWLYSVFFTLSFKWHDFQKNVIVYQMCLRFSLKLLSEIFHILRRTEWYVIKNAHYSLCKLPIFLVRVQWNLAVLKQIFEKYSNIKFHENPLSRSQVVLCGQTDKHDEANCCFSQFLQTCLKSVLSLHCK
jgi:hypothetical protein